MTSLQDKLQEYRANGALLSWLIDRKNRAVHLCRSNQEPEILDHPEVVSGDPEPLEFVLRMAEIW